MHIDDQLPPWSDAWQDRLEPRLAWSGHRFASLQEWRDIARPKIEDLACAPPPDEVAFDLRVEGAVIDRGTHTCHKVSFASTSAWRVPGYLLRPKGAGPFPAVVAIHDHGAFFYWGKEKVVETEALQRPGLRAFVDTGYGGQPFGDELARRGYVVLATDGFFWGERRHRVPDDVIGGGEPHTVDETRACNRYLYEQQALTAMNLMQMGLTWYGVLLHDDRRSAALLASLPEVDETRIACCGLSVGCYRSWTLAAMSDVVAAGIGICWMATQESLMRGLNNQNRSASAFSMLAPGMRRYLEIPDVASLACPKPLLLYAGRQDGLFPHAGTDAAFDRLRAVYQEHGAADRLVTEWWDVPHQFDTDMQRQAFDWLAGVL